jgi:hypothetical protein
VDARRSRTATKFSARDAQMEKTIVDVAAKIRGLPKETLYGIATREHRRTMRLALAAQMGLATLLVVSTVAAVFAFAQRNDAIHQANIATSRQLAAVSGNELSSNLDVAALLAAQAYRMNPDPQTLAAPIQADTASPHLVRYLPMGGPIAQLAGSGDGHVVVTGLADGRVLRWRLADRTPQTLFAFRSPVASIAVSQNGTTVLVSDGTDAHLWQDGRAPQRIGAPPGEKADVVALSPSGHTAVVHGITPADARSNSTSIVVFDVASGTVKATYDDPLKSPSMLMELSSDDELLLLDSGYGVWQRRRISDWSVEAASNANFGVHNYGVGASADRRFFTETNGASTIPVLRTNEPSDLDHPPLTAHAPISGPDSLTLSPNGSRLAVADSGTIYVSSIAQPSAPLTDPVALVGNGSINLDSVRFLGDNAHLISASGNAVTLWDLNQRDRLSTAAPTPIQSSCNACTGPLTSVSPDGRRVAAVDGSGSSALVQALDGGQATIIPGSQLAFERIYNAPVWDSTGQHVILPVSPTVTLPSGLPAVAHTWPAGGSDDLLAVTLSSDGHTVISVTARGAVYWQDAETGALRQTMSGPQDLAHGSNSLQSAAFNTSADLLATVDQGSATVIDLHRRTSVGTIGGGDISHVTFSGRRLLVQRQSGNMEVWDDHGSVRERVIPGDAGYAWWPPVANRQGTLVARQRLDTSVVLVDLDTGNVLATFPSASGSRALKTGVAFSPDSTQLVTITESSADSGPGQLVRRKISAAALVRTACMTAGRDLTAQEWQTYVGTTIPQNLSCQ